MLLVGSLDCEMWSYESDLAQWPSKAGGMAELVQLPASVS